MSKRPPLIIHVFPYWKNGGQVDDLKSFYLVRWPIGKENVFIKYKMFRPQFKEIYLEFPYYIALLFFSKNDLLITIHLLKI